MNFYQKIRMIIFNKINAKLRKDGTEFVVKVLLFVMFCF